MLEKVRYVVQLTCCRQVVKITWKIYSELLVSLSTPGQGDASKELRKKLTELSQKTKTLETELGKKKQHIDTADSRIQEFTKLVKEKDEKLQQRENEMKETEEKYKKYLEKAKAVINKMESSQNADPSVSPQLEMLRVSTL